MPEGDMPDRAELDGDGQIVYADNPTPQVGTAADAKNRAVRTFVQGLATDVLVAVVLLLFPIFGADSFDFTTTDWRVLGLSVAKTLVVTLLSYLARKLKISLDTTTA